jgi:FkbM family methyltransferase
MKRILSDNKKNVVYDLSKDIIKFDFWEPNSKRRLVIFENGLKNGEVFPIFFDKAYYDLPVGGKTVVDIGANIGDSSIYFALQGAIKVIGLEPFPKSYESAIRNVQINNLSNKITIKLAACSKYHGITNISSDVNSNVDSYMVHSNSKEGNALQVPLITLSDLISEYNIKGDILKIDCEGCEYDIILSASEVILSKFSYIQIEYHRGYKNLKKKLEKSGFSVSVGRPKLAINSIDQSKMYVGNIYARSMVSKPGS